LIYIEQDDKGKVSIELNCNYYFFLSIWT